MINLPMRWPFGQAYTIKLIQHLNKDNLEPFFATLRKFFANIAYDLALDHEKYYQSIFYAVFTLLGLTIEAQASTHQ